MIKEQGQSIQNVSESMDIGPTAIRRWLAQYCAEQPFDSVGPRRA